MTIPPPPGPGRPALRSVVCHVCLTEFVPNLSTDLYERGPSEKERQLVIPPGSSTALQAELMRNALVRCHSDKPAVHYLPIDFVRYQRPIVIGLIGMKGTGKSTLLASMIDEIEKNNGLRDYGLRARPLVPNKHEEFHKSHLVNFDNGQALDATPAAAENVDYADGILLIKGSDVPQPVIFWDVGGESFSASQAEYTRFIQAFTALIFVVDPDIIKGPDTKVDRTFRLVFDRLNKDTGDVVEYLDQPAAIVLAKADKLRFEPAVARWLAQRSEPGWIDHDQVDRESRDIYAFLHQCKAPWALIPFDTFRKCTLHVVSATGSNAPQPEQSAASSDPAPAYIRPLRTRRVLEPLVAILAMHGTINSPGADQVGR